MGAFFTNVQVRAGERPLSALIDAIRAGAGEVDEVAADGEPDRTVLVLPPDDGGWVAIYDEASESQEVAPLDALGALASRAMDAPAFTVLIHDSDILALSLFVGGVKVDRYDSHPGYFGERVSKKKRAEVAGKPEEWAPLLARGATVADLRAALTSEDLFAERTLSKVCELVGCDRRRAGTGHRYTVKDGDELPEGTITLRFRARARPDHERPIEGAPRFDAHSPYDKHPLALAVGDELRLGVSVKSAGGASKGISIVVWGSAIEQGLVSIARFEVLIGNVMGGAKHRMLTPERSRSKEGETLLVVDLPDEEIVAGSAMRGWKPGVDVRKMMEAFARATLHVNLVGSVVKDGRGEVSCAFVPHANRVDGAMVGQYDLTIDAPMPRPLHAQLGDATPSHLLRPLIGDRILVAMVAVDAPYEEAAAIARAAIEDALAVIGMEGNLQLGVHHRDPQKRPRTGKGKVGTMLRGKRFDGLVASLASEALVELKIYDGPAFDSESGPREALWGVSFGTSVLGDRADERVPSLALWADTKVLGEGKTAALREKWVAMIDRAMGKGGAQGVVLRSGWSGSAYFTAYEIACGNTHDIVTARSWVTRWVRVPGNDVLWLGRDLAARFDANARASLETIATLEERDGALRIALGRPSHAQLLELAISDLLPTARDAQAAVMAWHAARPE